VANGTGSYTGKFLATKPMEYLCLDIKYVWVHGESRWYYLLSIMDVFSRKILHSIFQKSVRKIDVVNMFRWLHFCYDLKRVIIRNESGSQFLANDVPNFLIHLEAQQEFTHVATPEENAYIEASHSIVQRVCALPFGHYIYVEALRSQHQKHLPALGRCLGFLGGAPQCLKFDNTRTAVVTSIRYEPVFTEAVEYFAAHYGTTAMAAKVGKPRDKASVEKAVDGSYKHIYAPCNQIFHSLETLNAAIYKQ
jgi:transposase